MTHAPDLCLSLSDVRKNYGTRRVLRGVTREVCGGTCLAITGTNGSGKSTLLKIVAGLLRPSRGEVAVQNEGKTTTDSTLRRRLVGYCAPDLALYPELTGTENLRFFAEVRGEPITDAVVTERLNAVGLKGRGNDLVSAYSSGMRQRLRIAFAIRDGNVPLLLLDEPSLALDAGGVAIVETLIARQKACNGIVLLATNDAREVAWADEQFSVEEIA